MNKPLLILGTALLTFLLGAPRPQWAQNAKTGRVPALHRIGDGFAPFCKQVRHVVCVRGVYNAALATRKVDWTRKHEHYAGPLTREALLAALNDKQQDLLALLRSFNIDAPIAWDATGVASTHFYALT